MKVLMARSSQAGFSLVELMLVLAISSSLAVIAFAGQRALRSRAQFDAAVNKIVASVADARNQASSGVNLVGTGVGTSGCAGGAPGGPGNRYAFVGVAVSVQNPPVAGLVRLDYYKAGPVDESGLLPGATSCVYQTQYVELPAPDVVVGAEGRMLFVRGNQGGVNVCPITNMSDDVRNYFRGAGCSTGVLTLNLSDGDGHTSRVIIDQSGLARRMN